MVISVFWILEVETAYLVIVCLLPILTQLSGFGLEIERVEK